MKRSPFSTLLRLRPRQSPINSPLSPLKRAYSTKPPHPRLQNLISRLPSSLRPYLTPLSNAPLSHITTFLLLHELTAILPLLTLSTYFHYSGILPTSLLESENVTNGVEKFTRYFERKGWFGMSRDRAVVDGNGNGEGMGGGEGEGSARGTRIVMEVACAYAITKLMLPVRLLASVWATPAVAAFGLRVVEGWRRSASRVNGASTSKSASSSTSNASTGNMGGLGPDTKAPPGENQQVFLLSLKLIAAGGVLFGFTRLFAKRPLMPEPKPKSRKREKIEASSSGVIEESSRSS